MSRLDRLLKRNAEMCANSFVLFIGELCFSPVGRPPLALRHSRGLIKLLCRAEVFRMDEFQLHNFIGQVAVIGFNREDPLAVDVELQVVFRHLKPPRYLFQWNFSDPVSHEPFVLPPVCLLVV